MASSAAPFAFAFLLAHLGVGWALSITAVLGSGAILAFLGVLQLTRRPVRDDRQRSTPEARQHSPVVPLADKG